MTRTVTIDELEDWEQSGATWRPLVITDERAVIELCTCSGEPMDQVQSSAPELIEYVRAHREE